MSSDNTWRSTIACTVASNEFWNIFTEFLPICHFTYSAIVHYCALPHTHPAAATLHEALLWDIYGSILQHCCSLFSHAGFRASARLSHTIWYVDYAGILLVFVWNAAPMSFLCAPSLERFWPLWRAINLCVTFALLALSLHLTCTHAPSASAATSGEGNFFQLFRSSRSLVALFLTAVGPSFVATAIAPFVCTFGHTLMLALIPTLIVSLGIKLLNVPERWLGKRIDFSFSPLHSHALWHLGVWLLEFMYYLIYVEAIQRRTAGESISKLL